MQRLAVPIREIRIFDLLNREAVKKGDWRRLEK